MSKKSENKKFRKMLKRMKEEQKKFVKKAYKGGIRVQCVEEDKKKTARDMADSNIWRGENIPRKIIRKNTQKKIYKGRMNRPK